MRVAQPTVHARFFNSSLGPTMAHGAPNARKFARSSFTSYKNLVIGTSIRSLRRLPIANVRCCAECFRPKGFRLAQWWSMGALGTSEHPNCSFGYTIRRRLVRDWGCSLVHCARRCRAACPSMIRARCPYDLPDPLLKLVLCCYPNALSTLTADLRRSGLVVYSNLRPARRYAS